MSVCVYHKCGKVFTPSKYSNAGEATKYCCRSHATSAWMARELKRNRAYRENHKLKWRRSYAARVKRPGVRRALNDKAMKSFWKNIETNLAQDFLSVMQQGRRLDITQGNKEIINMGVLLKRAMKETHVKRLI